MKDLLAFLPYAKASNQTLALAKGLYFLPKTIREVHQRNKQLQAWQRKRE